MGIKREVDLRQDWYHPRTLSDDVAIVLRGQIRYRPMASQINLLWLISHPDDARESELETFDHVFVASESYAKSLAERLSVPASQLLQSLRSRQLPSAERTEWQFEARPSLCG